MKKNSVFIILVIGAILSGCVSKGAEISGTYTNTYKEHPSFSKELVQEITFYNDGTWLYQSPKDSNSGLYTIHDKDIVITGQLVTAKFTIQEDGSLKKSDNSTWKKKT